MRCGQWQGGFRKTRVSNSAAGAVKAASMAKCANEHGHDTELMTLPSIKERGVAKAVYVTQAVLCKRCMKLLTPLRGKLDECGRGLRGRRKRRVGDLKFGPCKQSKAEQARAWGVRQTKIQLFNNGMATLPRLKLNGLELKEVQDMCNHAVNRFTGIEDGMSSRGLAHSQASNEA